jgi:hypothetical protein
VRGRGPRARGARGEVEGDRPDIPNPWEAYLPLFQAETWLELGPLVRDSPGAFHPEALDEVLPGSA